MWKSCLISCVVISAFRDGPSPKNHTGTRVQVLSRASGKFFKVVCAVCVEARSSAWPDCVSSARNNEKKRAKKQTLKIIKKISYEISGDE